MTFLSVFFCFKSNVPSANVFATDIKDNDRDDWAIKLNEVTQTEKNQKKKKKCMTVIKAQMHK